MGPRAPMATPPPPLWENDTADSPPRLWRVALNALASPEYRQRELVYETFVGTQRSHFVCVEASGAEQAVDKARRGELAKPSPWLPIINNKHSSLAIYWVRPWEMSDGSQFRAYVPDKRSVDMFHVVKDR